MVVLYEANQYSWAIVAEKYGQLTRGVWSIPNFTYLLKRIGEEKRVRNAVDEAAARAFAPGDRFVEYFSNKRGSGVVPMVKTDQIAYSWRKRCSTEAWWDNLDSYLFRSCLDLDPMVVHYE